MRRLALIAACAVLAGPALAGQPVTLKADAVDADGLITLGDLFDGAGASAGVAVARRTGTMVTLDALAVQSAARRAGLDWPNAQGVRRIAVRAGTLRGASASRANVEVLTYARSLATGEVVEPQDLVWGKAAATPADAPSDPEAIIGQAARRPLRAGQAVSARDVVVAQVIKTGDLITLNYENGAISLSLQGKSLGPAGLGETFNVQNVSSKKIIQAVAIGPGQAVVGPAADQMRLAARPSRLALR